MMGFGPGMMGGGFSIIFWIIIIGVAYYFFKEYNRKNYHHNDYGPRDYRHKDNRHDRGSEFENRSKFVQHRDEDSSAEIARQRYAKGEITKEELEEILDNLNN